MKFVDEEIAMILEGLLLIKKPYNEFIEGLMSRVSDDNLISVDELETIESVTILRKKTEELMKKFLSRVADKDLSQLLQEESEERMMLYDRQLKFLKSLRVPDAEQAAKYN